jgi:hypothetical protein
MKSGTTQHLLIVGVIGTARCQQKNHLLVVVVNKHKEEDETDESGDEGQESEEEALGGPHAVGLGVGRHLAAGHAHAVVILAMIPGVNVMIIFYDFAQFSMKNLAIFLKPML